MKKDSSATDGKNSEEAKDEKSFFQIIVHSFFIIPFLIAVFCLLLFAAMQLLTRENRDAYDYLEDVKIGGLTKRKLGAFMLSNKGGQAAFELSKILSNPKNIPDDSHFSQELISAFEHSRHDDNLVRQYLALAMGRTGRSEFVQPLLDGLKDEKEENLPAIIYALGMLKDQRALSSLYDYADHPDPRLRSITIVAIGNIEDRSAKPVLIKALKDPESNVQWGAALSLAKIQDASGRGIILDLLDRSYLAQYPEVDPDEQSELMLSAINVSSGLNDTAINNRLQELSTSDKNMKIRSAALEQLGKGN